MVLEQRADLHFQLGKAALAEQLGQLRLLLRVQGRCLGGCFGGCIGQCLSGAFHRRQCRRRHPLRQTPALPHGTQRRLKVLRKSSRVKNRRSQHLRAQAGAQRRQSGQIRGERAGAGHIVRGAACHPFRQASIAHQAQALAGDKTLTRHRERWNPHPQTLGCGGAARKRKRVQRDVHPGISGQVILARRLPFQRQPRRFNPVQGKALKHAVAQARLAQLLAFQKQPAARHRLQDLRPQRHHGLIHLAQVVEAAKGDVAMAQGRKGRHGRRVRRRRKAKPRLRQAPDGLGEVFLQRRRQAQGIGQHIVNRLHASGGEIAQPRHLHRRGLESKDGQAVVRGMARQVNQDVHTIAVNLPGQLHIRQPDGQTPAPKASLERSGGGVGADMVRISQQLKAPARTVGQCFDKALQKMGDRMLAQVARDKAHAQRACRVWLLGPAYIRLGFGSDQLAITPGIGQRLLAGVVGQVVAAKEQVVVGHLEFGLKRQCLATTCQCLVQAPEVLQGAAEVAVRLGEIRGDGQCPAVARYRLFKPPQIDQNDAQVVMGFGVTGLDLDRPPVASHGLCQAPEILQDDAQVVMGFGVIRLDLDRPPVARHGFFKPRQLLQRHAQVVVRRGVSGIDIQRHAVARQSLVELPLVHQGAAQVAMRIGEIRFERYRSPVTRHRVFQLTQICQCQAQVVVGFGVVRL